MGRLETLRRKSSENSSLLRSSPAAIKTNVNNDDLYKFALNTRVMSWGRCRGRDGRARSAQPSSTYKIKLKCMQTTVMSWHAGWGCPTRLAHYIYIFLTVVFPYISLLKGRRYRQIQKVEKRISEEALESPSS